MRKIILIASLVLVSASAEAGPSRGLIVASNEPVQSTVAEPLKAVEPAPLAAQKTETRPQPTAEKPAVKKRETDEQKARRIAARYGISW